MWVSPHPHVWPATRVADVVPLGVHDEHPLQIGVLDRTEHCIHRRTVTNRVCSILLELALDIWNFYLLPTELMGSCEECDTLMTEWTEPTRESSVSSPKPCASNSCISRAVFTLRHVPVRCENFS